MRLQRLRVERLRIVAHVDIEPDPGITMLVGPNGSGKTSILEALYLLGYGRSFRSPTRDVLIRRGESDLAVFAEVKPTAETSLRRLGLTCSARRWEARIDGDPVATLGDLLRCCPVVCFEPGSHALIAGPSDVRRRYLDWGLFHVEPTFASLWRRYHRSLKQRNALLKMAPAPSALDAWDAELSDAGTQLNELRSRYANELIAPLQAAGAALMPEAGPPELRYSPGWRLDRERLDLALIAGRERDMATGYTSVGPHRANWDVCYPALPNREAFSRGQEKLTALICVLAQAAHFAAHLGHWPIVGLDDLASELDREHQRRAVDAVAATGAQVWITGVEAPSGLQKCGATVTTFHVEQGDVRRAV